MLPKAFATYTNSTVLWILAAGVGAGCGNKQSDSTLQAGGDSVPAILGHLDGLNPNDAGGCFAYGWAAKRDASKETLRIDLYAGGPAGSKDSTYKGSTKADQPSPDVVAGFKISGDHRFSMQLTHLVADSGKVPVYAYAIDRANQVQLLGGSPLTCTVYVKSGDGEPPEIESCKLRYSTCLKINANLPPKELELKCAPLLKLCEK